MVATVYSRIPDDPDETHRPEPSCPERVRIEREGNAVNAEAEIPPIARYFSGGFHEMVYVWETVEVRRLRWCRVCVRIFRTREYGSGY